MPVEIRESMEEFLFFDENLKKKLRAYKSR